MEFRYLFLAGFVSVDIIALAVYWGTYRRRRRSGKPFPSVMWASYPILIFMLFFVPLLIIFEEVIVGLVMGLLFLAALILVPLARWYHIFAYPRGKRFRGKWQVRPFRDYDDERRPFTD